MAESQKNIVFFRVSALKGSRTWLNEFARPNAVVWAEQGFQAVCPQWVTWSLNFTMNVQTLHVAESVDRAVGLEFVSFGCGTQMQGFSFRFLHQTPPEMRHIHK